MPRNRATDSHEQTLALTTEGRMAAGSGEGETSDGVMSKY